jgi:uncharacterized protein (DUF488 family)
MSRDVELFTIGVFGSTAETFFGALESAGIDTFCDVRLRRGVRGSEYAYANATRLQAELSRRGIRYYHRVDLAPTQELRAIQFAADEAHKTAKRKRTELDPAYARAYRERILSTLDSEALLESLGPDARRVVFFCVEREPAACHRSLLTQQLQRDLGLSVTHLMP